MTDIREQSAVVSSYFYRLVVTDLTNYSTSIEQSVAFCATILKNLKHVQATVMAQLLRDFDRMLPEISDPNQFNTAVRISRLLEESYLDRYWSDQLFAALSRKISTAVAGMPDDVWRVKILAQLSQKCMAHVFANLDHDMAAAIKDTSRMVLGGEKILAALGEKNYDDTY